MQLSETIESVAQIIQFIRDNRHMNLLSLNQILPQLRDYFQAAYGNQLVHLILFGSQARQEANLDSDIDILVVLDRAIDAWTENERTAGFISELCLEHSMVISVIFTSSVQYQAKSTSLFRNIDREGILL